jgi:FkbM family methyltransferase
MMQKVKNLVKKIVYYIIPPPYTSPSYSQAGEDGVIRYLFNDFGKRTISYLDLGTNSPKNLNNTYLFYTNNSNGVCVEADSTLIDEIKKVRPKDKVINAGVSVSNQTEADFYIFKDPSINTFDKKEAEKRTLSGNNKILKVIKVPLININDLIKNNFKTYPDLISIDIEGLDLAVLKSLDFALYPIPVICSETCVYSENHIRPKDLSILKFMETKGYEVYADTYINTIFINKNWFYNV